VIAHQHAISATMLISGKVHGANVQNALRSHQKRLSAFTLAMTKATSTVPNHQGALRITWDKTDGDMVRGELSPVGGLKMLVSEAVANHGDALLQLTENRSSENAADSTALSMAVLDLLLSSIVDENDVTVFKFDLKHMKGNFARTTVTLNSQASATAKRKVQIDADEFDSTEVDVLITLHSDKGCGNSVCAREIWMHTACQAAKTPCLVICLRLFDYASLFSLANPSLVVGAFYDVPVDVGQNLLAKYHAVSAGALRASCLFMFPL